jgi:acetyl-CoA/propionyl-CoA carboxylase biotin carboxyl carrier protein
VLKKVLIANRGEIAVRIMRTCRELGIATVAVYSDPDRDAAHTRYADEAFALGGRTAEESYLNPAALLDVVRRCGADGVHPGYGFLAESAAFAQAVLDAGVTFIGPPPAAVAKMGDKILARHAADAAGVPTLAGTRDPLDSADELVAFGDAHGWPVAVKAAHGGGGRGLKVVTSAADGASAMESAEREAKAYFGRPELYAERFLTRPRHIEMQLMADSQGTVVWLGERDCTVQRRHQKLIEETPAPDFPDDVRRAMGEASVRLARECDYVGAGTVEFLYEDGAFYFLEMNTRLQVEHPVTELVTGLDLVELQLRAAAGEPLGFEQDDLTSSGHAIEVRVNAEDPAGGRFAPTPGRLTTCRLPGGPGVRVDAGYTDGDEVSPYYDNLVAKIITWAPDRDRARGRMLRALAETQIEGVATTIPAQALMLEHPQFLAATHSTNWVDRELDLSAIVPLESSGGPSAAAHALPDVTAEIAGQRFTVKLWTSDPQGFAAALGGTATPQARVTNPPWRSRRGVPQFSTWTPSSAQPEASRDGLPARPGPDAADQRACIVAPMQGTVVRVLVSAGDEVKIGDDVCVIEAMKMENVVAATTTGRITEVLAAVGDAVEQGRPILRVAELGTRGRENRRHA